MLAVGATAPNFSLGSAQGPTVSLVELLADRAVLLVFYPYAFTTICTAELDEVRDHLDSFDTDVVQLVAVSCDTKFALRAFAKWRGYEFALLSDFWPHGETARSYGVFDEGAGMAVRGTFLIDRAGVIRFAEANDPGQARRQDGWREAVNALTQE